ncbi:MAG TPA: ATP-binding protein [Candidatus Aquilonibacter sp.]|nr:ATP-binding protein [Candidatus Aquilonibacter sp.]
METLFYLRLIALTTGTVVYLFLIALILGNRRPRLFERILFFLVLALFFIYAGGLLEMNARIEYAFAPDATRLLYSLLIASGLLFLPALLVHAHLQFYEMAAPGTAPRWAKVLVLAPLYVAPALSFVVLLLAARPPTRTGVRFGPRFGPLDQMASRLVRFFPWTPEATFLFVGILLSLAIDLGILNLKPRIAEADRRFFKWMAGISAALMALLIATQAYRRFETQQIEGLMVALIVVGLLPGVLFGYYALRHNFLDFGEQRNLVYALSATVLALLYLALVHRVSGWLQPELPPEATASILLFVLIFLFEPMERLIGPALQEKFRERVERLQRLTAELQAEARHGDVDALVSFAERRIAEEFGLAAVRLTISGEPLEKRLASPGGLGHVFQTPLVKGGRKSGERVGTLEAASTGVYLTGETTGALQFVAEQMPALIDLARLIEEKLRLERELSERERLALLGQMAASVSHNLRNPLSSMKTILQVQLENPAVPESVRQDCALVVSEIDRMSAKLTQLLQFSRPAKNGQQVEAVRVARDAAELLRREAERRGVRLEFDGPGGEVFVHASEEALNEVLANLLLNAVEAQPNGGYVHVGVAAHNGDAEFVIQDDGPGISSEARERMFEPFYTTKATGTGLGLSIVMRRAAEMGAQVACESPINNGRGARFRVRIPVAAAD